MPLTSGSRNKLPVSPFFLSASWEVQDLGANLTMTWWSFISCEGTFMSLSTCCRETSPCKLFSRSKPKIGLSSKDFQGQYQYTELYTMNYLQHVPNILPVSVLQYYSIQANAQRCSSKAGNDGLPNSDHSQIPRVGYVGLTAELVKNCLAQQWVKHGKATAHKMFGIFGQMLTFRPLVRPLTSTNGNKWMSHLGHQLHL